MVYTEIKERNDKKYYYRVISIRKGNKTSKKRKYLGVNLSQEKINKEEVLADKQLKVNTKPNELNKLIPKIIKILKEYNIRKAGIFGSYARGDFKDSSDVDILVEPIKNMGFKFAGLEIELAKALKKKVDLVSYNGISPYLKERILSQEVRII